MTEAHLPRQLDDPQFGRLAYDPALNWYACDAAWEGTPVTLHLSMDDAESADEVLGVARALWSDSGRWDQRIRGFAADHLLPLKNESWLDDGEGEVDRAAFLGRMKLEDITVYPGGAFEFTHEDGGLFAGHAILVAGDLEEGPTDADIPG